MYSALVVHLPVFLLGIVTIEQAGISTLLIVVRWVTFITMSIELMSKFLP